LPFRLVIALIVCLAPDTARADWLLTPFIGTAFAGETTFIDFGRGAGQTKMTVGGSAALLGDGILGLEADIGHSPRFFQEDDPAALVLRSRVTMLTGSVIIAAPRAVTRESLRPYLVGGLGLMQARSVDIIPFLPFDKNLLGLSLGAGAIGFLTERTGIRFDLRHLKAVTGEDGPLARPGTSRLSFWRATIGVTFRY
jgi:hypothetical protein